MYKDEPVRNELDELLFDAQGIKALAETINDYFLVATDCAPKKDFFNLYWILCGLLERHTEKLEKLYNEIY